MKLILRYASKVDIADAIYKKHLIRLRNYYLTHLNAHLTPYETIHDFNQELRASNVPEDIRVLLVREMMNANVWLIGKTENQIRSHWHSGPRSFIDPLKGWKEACE